jgi:5'-3' exonuclease
MGIPSYYRFLCQKNRNIIQPNYLTNGQVILCLDFNCIVYYCLSKAGEYVDDISYESNLIKEVCKYVEHIWRSANKPNTVFIAVDGVVPMAKMKQQRMRRFKSIFMEPYEIENKVKVVGQKSWDKNAITPGTLFMKKLHSALLELCSTHNNWNLSGYDQFGEGEHKVMNYIREYETCDKTVLVYGLDADLILLSMLQSKQNIFLMREEMEFNSVVKDIYEKEQFLYLNINNLKSSLFVNPTEQYIQDYIMMMSLLGNDFLPHSLSLTIKDGGYNILFNNLKQFHKQNKFLVENGYIRWDVLKEFIGSFMQEEESLIEQQCKKKKMCFNYKGHNEYEQKMASVYTLPSKWFVESDLYDGKMKNDWQDTYYSKYLNSNKNTAIEQYLKGLQWILDYYTGNVIEYDWYYPYMYTPLWSDLYTRLVKYDMKYERFVYEHTTPITPEQQLTLVLPPESFHLNPNKKYTLFPTMYPQFYPKKFGVHSLGKKWIYECESNIPVLPSKFIRLMLV